MTTDTTHPPTTSPSGRPVAQANGSPSNVRVPVLDQAEALRLAADIAGELAVEATLRDRERILPARELERLVASGLLAITVPEEYGGAGLAPSVVAEVLRLLATGDASVAQIPHSHFVYVNALRHVGTPDQQRLLFGEVLAGRWFGNAQAETGGRHAREHATTLYPAGPGRWRLRGVKGYCTGALFADWIPVLAHLGIGGPSHVAWVRRHAPGVTVVDDWDGMGQRTTASGTVRLDDVEVDEAMIAPYHAALERPHTFGAYAQLLHAGLDAGIARAALAEAAAFVRTRSRPHPDAGVERASDDAVVVHAFGEMEVRVRAAEALLDAAGRVLDATVAAELSDELAATASLAVAAARVATTEAAIDVSNRLFEVAGTRAAMDGLNLHRFWRDARTHTLHDAAGWKVQHLGRFALDGTLPPSSGQL